MRDGRSIERTVARLKVLEERRGKVEVELKIHYPSIRNGDSLFQDYETLDFRRPGYERYEKIIREMRLLSSRLHENTKFERLAKSRRPISFMWWRNRAWSPPPLCRAVGDCSNGKGRNWH